MPKKKNQSIGKEIIRGLKDLCEKIKNDEFLNVTEVKQTKTSAGEVKYTHTKRKMRPSELVNKRKSNGKIGG